MSTRRRQSKAFQTLSDELFAEYRLRCLSRALGGREDTLEHIEAWLAEQGVRCSPSMIHRDAQYFAAVEEKKQQLRVTAETARDIIAGAQESGAIAATQTAAVSVLTQMVMDYLIQHRELKTEDLNKFAGLGIMLSRLVGSQINVYRAEVERKSREAADKAAALAAGSSGDVKQQLEELADSILGVGK